MLECYGKALFDLALEENKLHDVKEEFYTFRKIFKYDPELQKFMK